MKSFSFWAEEVLPKIHKKSLKNLEVDRSTGILPCFALAALDASGSQRPRVYLEICKRFFMNSN
jgi:hypothetical protein